MKIFTEKGFEMWMEREMALREQNRWVQDELLHLQKQIDELRWKNETKTATKVNTDV